MVTSLAAAGELLRGLKPLRCTPVLTSTRTRTHARTHARTRTRTFLHADPNGTVNFYPTGGDGTSTLELQGRGVLTLGWGYCWNSPDAPHSATGRIANTTAAEDYFVGEVRPSLISLLLWCHAAVLPC